jgi:hypothetical protein
MGEPSPSVPRMLPPVFFLSAAVIGWQLALMRCLLISRYYHFSFLVISCALLGFGAGGVVLSVNRAWFARHVQAVFRWGLLCFALSLPLCFRMGELLPLQVYFAPNVIVPTLAWWCLFWGIHSLPFVLAGGLVGLALMSSGTRVHRVYAANLAGSAAGAPAAIMLMDLVAPNALVLPLSISVLLSGFFLAVPSRAAREILFPACTGIACLALGALWLAGPDRFFPLKIDQFKPLAHIQTLVEQGSARRQATLYGPRGRLDLFSSPSFHTLLALSPVQSPPPMSMLLRDGFEIGSVLSITDMQQTRFLERTLSALPYRLVKPKRVLILGETGGLYVWLARRSEADHIVVVQPDSNIFRLLERYGSGVLNDPRVRTVVAEPRAFLDNTSMTFDIIHLPALEGFSAGSGGIGGLREDYLATDEGFGRCLAALTPSGIACVIRGIQDPPRDNLKIAATWIDALEQRKIQMPGDHVLIARDELSVATLAAGSPFNRIRVKNFRDAARDMSLETDWFPGVKPEETNRVHVLPGPTGYAGSWYSYAMTRLLSPERESFFQQWICNIRPATDDKPFFYDFFRWHAIARLREAFGPLWPTRTEMGFLVLILSAVLTATVAGLLLPAPIFLLGRKWPAGLGKSCVMIYFAALGTGFMFIEMSLIQMFTRFLGDPVLAAALVVAGLLVLAGLGSSIQPAATARIPLGALGICLGIGAMLLIYSSLLPSFFAVGASLAGPWKAIAGLLVLAPLAVLMGMPFPWGLSVLHRAGSVAVPLAWAANGFASVVSASVAVLLAMSLGFTVVMEAAAGAYGLAAAMSLALGRIEDPAIHNTGNPSVNKVS